MKRNRKKTRILILLILLLGVTLGYAALATTLKIDGIANIKKNLWSIYWDENSIAVTQGSASVTLPDVVDGEDGSENTKITWEVNFSAPGDFYEFTVDAANAGTLDAMITGIDNKVNNTDIDSTPSPLPEYIKYEVTYANGSAPAVGHLLAKKEGNTPTTEKYKVRVEWLTDVDSSSLVDDELTLNFKYEVTYGQATSDACHIPTTFQDDDWDIIACNVKLDPTVYPLGATKTIEMDLDNNNTPETYTLRVANNTTPSECNATGFSQTACGFVLEFQDVITTHRMNPYENSATIDGDGNKGGWEHSEMRTFVNSDIYNALPSELSSKIISTKVVSGHGSVDSTNFTTPDKLYLLSSHEVWEDVDNWISDVDTAYNNTRQLDYYKMQGVTSATSTCTPAKKTGSSPYYWIRSASRNNMSTFIIAGSPGQPSNGLANESLGVSPAFRLAE